MLPDQFETWEYLYFELILPPELVTPLFLGKNPTFKSLHFRLFWVTRAVPQRTSDPHKVQNAVPYLQIRQIEVRQKQTVRKFGGRRLPF